VLNEKGDNDLKINKFKQGYKIETPAFKRADHQYLNSNKMP
jgi:hypothetical protein